MKLLLADDPVLEVKGLRHLCRFIGRPQSAAALIVVTVASCSGSPETLSAKPTESVPPIDLDNDVTAVAGLPLDSSTCLVFDDFDADGDPDLLVGSPRASAVDLLTVYQNRGDGTFDASPIELPGKGVPASCTTGDVDGDGLLDIIVGHAPPDVTVLLGRGPLEFEEARRAISSLPSHFGDVAVSAVALFDYDLDGDLDLIGGRSRRPSPESCGATDSDFYCEPSERTPWASTFLFRNIDGRSWEEIRPAPGNPVTDSVNGFGFIDIDRDGWLDVFMTNDFSSNGLYRNAEGTGSFEDITAGWGMDVYNHGMGSAFGDFDGNGEWDIYVADLGPDQFWLGQGGRMTDAALVLGVYEQTLYHSGWAPQAHDFNQDGYLDLFVTNSALVAGEEDLVSIGLGQPVTEAPPQADFLFTSDQQGGYLISTVSHREAEEQKASATVGVTAVADYDGDGDLDIAQFYLGPPTFRLLENRTQGGNWMQVELESAWGHAYGAEVEARSDGVVIDRRVLHGANGSVGKSWEVLHFGLGQLDSVDELVVWWPGRQKETFAGPFGANQTHLLRQGES